MARQTGGEWQEGETDGMNVYTCQSCGGEIIADENTGASKLSVLWKIPVIYDREV